MNYLRLVVAVCAFASVPLLGQGPAATPASAAPAQAPAAPQLAAAPQAPADPFPPANPKYFTATTPTLETVNSFLQALWGYDENRLYRVMAIQKTPAPGVTKVVVFVTDKSPNAKVASAVFYTTPDGKHALAEGAGIVPFAADPFTDLAAIVRTGANGAYRGSASKDFEIVEFADLQCPHCKEAQPTMDQIVKDFPKARVVFQPFPLVDVHPSAFAAAAYGVCVQKESNEAFFRYADGVFDTQGGLLPNTQETVLKAAVRRAGLDADKIAACAATQATKDAVNADIKLAEDAGVDQTPMLSVNGRFLPVGQLPYEQLKRILVFQAQMDHVETGAAPDILTRPAPPQLTDLPK